MYETSNLCTHFSEGTNYSNAISEMFYRQNGVLVDDKNAQHAESNWITV